MPKYLVRITGVMVNKPRRLPIHINYE